MVKVVRLEGGVLPHADQMAEFVLGVRAELLHRHPPPSWLIGLDDVLEEHGVDVLLVVRVRDLHPHDHERPLDLWATPEHLEGRAHVRVAVVADGARQVQHLLVPVREEHELGDGLPLELDLQRDALLQRGAHGVGIVDVERSGGSDEVDGHAAPSPLTVSQQRRRATGRPRSRSSCIRGAVQR